MAKIHSIRRRIKSVKNIHQITKAMELVSASKLRRAQEAALRSRMYTHSVRAALRNLQIAGNLVDHPLFKKRPVTNHTLVIFTSDRGLAGAYNTNLYKTVVQLIQNHPDHTFHAIVIGQKGAQFLAKLQSSITIDAVYTNWPTHTTSADIRPIATSVSDSYLNESTDQVSVVYTDFESLSRQHATSLTLLPLTASEEEVETELADLVFEPSPAEVLTYILPRLLELQLYQASLEAAASEHGMRMLAMKNASDNAEDITSDLTLEYNGARQASITQELAEITSGAEAIS